MAVRDDKMNIIQWNVPLAQFHVDRRLYHPRPALYSPIASLSTDELILQWQLSLEQGKEDARVFLHHCTPNIPNQGVRYNVFALRTDGTTIKLTDDIRKALAKYRPPPCQSSTADNPADIYQTFGGSGQGCVGATSGSLRQSLRTISTSLIKSSALRSVEQMIWNGKTVKLRIAIGWNSEMWHPCVILTQKIQAYQRESIKPNTHSGLVGELLWSQVKILKDADEPVPASTDLVLVCPNGDHRVVAHRAVVAVYSQPFRSLSLSGPSKGPIILNSKGLGSAALYEVMHYIYRLRLSQQFDQVPLNEMLEASHVFGLPEAVNWEIEKQLALILNVENRDRMEFLAGRYNLKIIKNMITKLDMDTAELARPSMSVTQMGIVNNNDGESLCHSTTTKPVLSNA